jgi:hypothetical protein
MRQLVSEFGFATAKVPLEPAGREARCQGRVASARIGGCLEKARTSVPAERLSQCRAEGDDESGLDRVVPGKFRLPSGRLVGSLTTRRRNKHP